MFAKIRSRSGKATCDPQCCQGSLGQILTNGGKNTFRCSDRLDLNQVVFDDRFGTKEKDMKKALIRWFGFMTSVLLLAASVAQAQPPSPFAVETNIKGVYAYTQPPAGFDPTVAPVAELELYGYPPRPAANAPASAVREWNTVTNPTLQRVIPKLATTNMYNLPARKLTLDAKSNTGEYYNWSGFALSHKSPAFTSVTGRWTVPTVKQAANTCTGGWDYSSEWVGIDGFNNSLLFQSGSAANAYCDTGATGLETTTGYFPWIEWLPAAEYILEYSNGALLPFEAGDYVIVTVTATGWSGGESKNGKVVFSNVTKSWQISLSTSASALHGTYVIGNSAEWIVERTTVNGEYATLPNYVADPWWDTIATDVDGKTYTPASPGTGTTSTNITMVTSSKVPISYVDLFGSDALWFFPEGPAVAP
jgi:Peptidase A4 family